MIDIRDAHRKILKEYSRSIIHMRAQMKLHRLSLVFGAGLNESFHLPNWQDLVQAIANDAEVQGKDILKGLAGRDSLPYKTELLFQHYRTKQASIDGAKMQPEAVG